MYILIISVIAVGLFLLIIAASVRVSLELVKLRRKGLALTGYFKSPDQLLQNPNLAHEKKSESETQ